MKIHPLIKEYSLHLEALCVIVLLIVIWSYAYQDHIIKKEINENCGWGEDDYYCFCEKSESIAIKNKMNGSFELDIDELNFTGLEDDWMDK